jgi:hypothetical protein
MTTQSDNFNRADSTNLGANWTERLGDHSIVSNAVTSPSEVDSRSTFSGAAWGSTYQRSGCIVGGIGAGPYAGVVVFMSGSGGTLNGLEFVTNSSSGAGNTMVLEWVTGTQTELFGVATTFANGDLIELEVNLTANEIKCYKNGAQVGTTVTYNGSPSGEPGIALYSNGTVEDWTATDVQGGAQSQAPRTMHLHRQMRI